MAEKRKFYDARFTGEQHPLVAIFRVTIHGLRMNISTNAYAKAFLGSSVSHKSKMFDQDFRKSKIMLYLEKIRQTFSFGPETK